MQPDVIDAAQTQAIYLVVDDADVVYERVVNAGAAIAIDIADDLSALLAKVDTLGGGALVWVPKMAVAGIGWLAYVKDPDGNMFGMLEADMNAA